MNHPLDANDPKMRLCILEQQCLIDSERWFGDTVDWKSMSGLIHHVLSLCGEAGELANLIKKVDRGSLDINNAVTRNDIAMEIADVFVYLLNIAGLLQLDLDKLYTAKRGHNEARFIPQRRAREEARKDAGQR